MYRRGYDRDSFGDMELEMMRREMMYRYGDDLDPEELEELLMEMKPSEEELKRRDRQELIYWINSQMLPPKIRSCHNHHDLHGEGHPVSLQLYNIVNSVMFTCKH